VTRGKENVQGTPSVYCQCDERDAGAGHVLAVKMRDSLKIVGIKAVGVPSCAVLRLLLLMDRTDSGACTVCCCHNIYNSQPTKHKSGAGSTVPFSSESIHL
jgi:hypothetical protein